MKQHRLYKINISSSWFTFLMNYPLPFEERARLRVKSDGEGGEALPIGDYVVCG
jgi:hypothetical protein